MRPRDHPQDKIREQSYQMAYDAAAIIEEKARQIREKIEKTKSDMFVGNEFVA